VAARGVIRGKVGPLIRKRKSRRKRRDFRLIGTRRCPTSLEAIYSHLVLERSNPLFKSVKTIWLVFNRLQMVLESWVCMFANDLLRFGLYHQLQIDGRQHLFCISLTRPSARCYLR
jgi:hypothetical protein